MVRSSGKCTVLDLKLEYSTLRTSSSFSLGAELSGDITGFCILTRDLLEWNFGISEPHRVKLA